MKFSGCIRNDTFVRGQSREDIYSSLRDTTDPHCRKSTGLGEEHEEYQLRVTSIVVVKTLLHVAHHVYVQQ